MPSGKPAADPASPAEVATVLLTYLSSRFSAVPLRYLAQPSPIENGWETYTYGFQVQRTSALPPALARPLILRIFASPQGLPRLRHEFAAQQYLHQSGYRVAEPLLREETCGLFGGPFQIMEQLPGTTMLEELLHRPWMIWSAAQRMAQTHAGLHALPTAGFPCAPQPFLGRRLDEIRDILDAYDLHGLRPGWDWLCAHRPAEPIAPRILHLDFHPLNLLDGLDHNPGVLDWTEADVGDHHADLATTLMFFQCSPLRRKTWCARSQLRLGAFFLRRWYLRAYRHRVPVDRRRLCYYRAWATLRRLSICGRWLRAGPEINGCKPSLLHHLGRDHLEALQLDFQRWTGVEVCLARP